jgi:hypothetical protein
VQSLEPVSSKLCRSGVSLYPRTGQLNRSTAYAASQCSTM